MRKGTNWWVTLGLAAALAGGSGLARAQAPGSLAVPYFQDQLEGESQEAMTPRLAAMGGVYVAVDDREHNLINLWRLDRNPAALLENMVSPSVEILGAHQTPKYNYTDPSTGDVYQFGQESSKFGGAILETKHRTRSAARLEVSYRGIQDKDLAGIGLDRTLEGNGPFLDLTVGQRTGKLHYGVSLNVYNVDESRLFNYDYTIYDSAAISRIDNTPEITTDRVAYHSIQEVFGLQFELTDGLRLGATLRMEQQRQDGASSNERMVLDALNNHSLIGGSLGATYRYKDKIAFSGRFWHNSFDGVETYDFSRRQKKAVTDPPIVSIGTVADHRYREYAINSRGTWRVDPKYLQLGLVYNRGKLQRFTTAAVGYGSYNYFDSTYLANTIGADSVGLTAGPLVDNSQEVNDYVQWILGSQFHPVPAATLAAEYGRYSSNLLLQGLEYNPETKQWKVGGEYVVGLRLALRAGYSQLDSDDRSNIIDKTSGHQVTLGIGYELQSTNLQLVYLNGTVQSDAADPSHAETKEQGLRVSMRRNF